MDFRGAMRKPRGDVEITVVEVAVPGNGDEGTAHKPFDGGRIEPIKKGFKIIVKVSRLFEPGTEPAQGNVGDTVKIIENDAVPLKILFELLFRLVLIARQTCAGRVDSQIQRQSAGRAAI